jgi:RHS repeat-associated protein
MGCQKITYHYSESALEEEPEHFLRVPGQNGERGKKGTNLYPFGSIARTSKTNEDNHYRYGYQGQFSEEDEQTGWNSFELRMLDTKIGRWLSPDPYGQYWSSYLAMGNDPANNTDPDGGWSKLGAWIRNGFSMEGVYDAGGKKGWGFNTTTFDGAGIGITTFNVGKGNYGEDRGPTISAYEPNFFENAKTIIDVLPMGGDVIGEVLYNTTDELYMSLLQTGKNRYHLDGGEAYRDQITDAGVNTLTSIAPISKATSPAYKAVTASGFSKLFKGTFVSSLKPKIRGILNKALNKTVVKEQANLFHGAATSGAELIIESENRD